MLSQQLRLQGSANIAMIGMMTGAVLNCFLDPLFIFVFDMGVKGAAAATMVSQMISFIILFTYRCGQHGNLPINLRHFSPSASRYLEMSKGGISALLRQGFTSLTGIFINLFARVYGDTAIAAISITNRIVLFSNSAILGFGQGFQPVCRFNYGAKIYSRVKKAFWFCLRIATIAAFLLACAAYLYTPLQLGAPGYSDQYSRGGNYRFYPYGTNRRKCSAADEGKPRSSDLAHSLISSMSCSIFANALSTNSSDESIFGDFSMFLFFRLS